MNLNELKNADLILFHTNGFRPISWGIRKLTHSYFNHVGIFRDGYIIEALRKVTKVPIDKYIDNKRYDIKIVRVKQSAYKDKEEYSWAIQSVLTRAEESVGIKYDYTAIIYLGIKYSMRGILRKIIPQRWNPFQHREKFFCSELICQCFHETSSIFSNIFAGIKYPFATCGTITPHDIWKSKNTEEI